MGGGGKEKKMPAGPKEVQVNTWARGIEKAQKPRLPLGLIPLDYYFTTQDSQNVPCQVEDSIEAIQPST